MVVKSFVYNLKFMDRVDKIIQDYRTRVLYFLDRSKEDFVLNTKEGQYNAPEEFSTSYNTGDGTMLSLVMGMDSSRLVKMYRPKSSNLTYVKITNKGKSFLKSKMSKMDGYSKELLQKAYDNVASRWDLAI